MGATAGKGKDPFAGYGPTAVRCRWLTPGGADAPVVRLIVDDDRWQSGFANAVYQKAVLNDVAAALGPKTKLVIAPAGMITAGLAAGAPGSQNGLLTALAELDVAASNLSVNGWPARTEILLGIDGCEPGTSTPLQTLTHANGQPRVTATTAVVKLYPTGAEQPTLLGWRIVEAAGGVPRFLQTPRTIKTAVGDVLALVCHEAVSCSTRSKTNVRDPNKIAVRQFLAGHLGRSPEFVAMATHHLTARGGNAFQAACTEIVGSNRTTVVPSCFAPTKELDKVAEKFPAVGPRCADIGTLILKT